MVQRIINFQGTTVLHMLSNFLQDEAIRTGLNEYLTSYHYSVAEAKDLWEVFSRSTNYTLDVEVNINISLIVMLVIFYFAEMPGCFG